MGIDNHLQGVPLVTVIMVCYDGNAHLVRRAATSLRMQTFTDFEVICWYDGALDPDAPKGSDADLLHAAFHGFPGMVRIYSGGEKTGFHVVPRNRATPLSYGEYIVNMDADNEFAPTHLENLLRAIRTPDKFGRRPDFTYSRRQYVKDATCTEDVVEGPSEFIEWETGKHRLAFGPRGNFIDTGDFMVAKSALYELGRLTDQIWNCNLKRFPDYDIVKRMARAGFIGWAVDCVTNIYHWTGANIQITQPKVKGVSVIPEDFYERMILRGQIKGDA